MEPRGKQKNLSKVILLLACLFIFQDIFAQSDPPSNLSGSALRTWLVDNWYDGYHTTLGYSGTNGARSHMYNIIDNHNDSVVCVYSGHREYRVYDETRAASTSGMLPINCEHTIPQSFFNENEPMVSDIHHLFPTYSTWNGTRSNYPFEEIDDNSTTKWMYESLSSSSIPNSNIDAYSEFKSNVFEPREDHKGNLARAVFYFYTMYPTEAGAMSLVGDMYMFYTWHILDPVDQDEIDRNEEVGTYQGNRNPYILYPDRIKDAWEITNEGATITASSSTTDIQLDWTDLAIETEYLVYRSTDNVNYTLQGSALPANSTNYTDNNVVENTTYYYYVSAVFADGDTIVSNIVNEQLSSGSGSGGSGSGSSGSNASDLFISEYIEGSSFNKSIEIANFTGGSIDLSNYELGRQTNGAGGWSSLPLSGTLADQSVYVISNNGATITAITSNTDLFTTNSTMDFNGNDPVALMDNSFAPPLIVDIVGTENGGSANFAKDKTLVRNSNITSPNDSYTTNEWTFHAKDYVDDIGSHTYGAVLPVTLTDFEAIAKEKYNYIYWETQEEINHDYFILERSSNGYDFSPIANLESKTASQRYYSFEDFLPLERSYYRLQQVDLDGTMTYFETIVVQRKRDEIVLDLYPVPAVNFINVNVRLPKSSKGEIHVFDAKGKMMMQRDLDLINGNNLIQLPIEQLSIGLYFVKLWTVEQQLISKFMKRK